MSAAPRPSSPSRSVWPIVLSMAIGAHLGCAGVFPAPRVRQPEIAAPWELAADATPTQRLFRVRYEGPEGKLSFKLSVYLESPERFRLQAADALGRKLWSLAVGTEERAVWINHREKTYCRTDPRSGLVFVPLTRLPLEAVPRLLDGRLPEPPFADLRQAPGQVSFRDILGREWTAVLDPAGDPERWSLLENGEPVAWWQLEIDRPGALFSDRRGRQQVRWREIVREALDQPIAPAAPPEGYEETRCTPTG